jgi:hypothetical protein
MRRIGLIGLMLVMVWPAWGQGFGRTMAFRGASAARPAEGYLWDTNAVDFMTRMGGVGSGVSNAVDTFVKSLKGDGTWTNFLVFYPFMGANAGSNAQNLVSSSNTIVWHGSWNTMNATGVAGNGVDNTWGDTGWNPSAQSQTTNVGAFFFISASNPGNTNNHSTVFGANVSGNQFSVIHNTTAPFVGYINNNAINFQSYGSGLYNAVYFGRVGTAGVNYNGSNTFSSATTGSGTAPNCNVGIAGKNYSGSSYYGFTGLIQFVGIGYGTLSTNQYQTLYNACVTLNTALGR